MAIILHLKKDSSADFPSQAEALKGTGDTVYLFDKDSEAIGAPANSQDVYIFSHGSIATSKNGIVNGCGGASFYNKHLKNMAGKIENVYVFACHAGACADGGSTFVENLRNKIKEETPAWNKMVFGFKGQYKYDSGKNAWSVGYAKANSKFLPTACGGKNHTEASGLWLGHAGNAGKSNLYLDFNKTTIEAIVTAYLADSTKKPKGKTTAGTELNFKHSYRKLFTVAQ